MPEQITRVEFGRRAAALLTDGQKAEIRRLHEQVSEGWHVGCAAASESANCCVEEIFEDLRGAD
jgi:hypothetical protein